MTTRAAWGLALLLALAGAALVLLGLAIALGHQQVAQVRRIEGTAQQAYRRHSHLTGAAQRITRLSR